MMRKAILAALAMCCMAFFYALSSDASRGVKLTAIKDLSHRSGKLGEFKALIIGINDYADPKIPDLETAVNDANTMAGILSEKYGFKVEHLFDHKATRMAIYQKLRRLATSTRPNDSVLIYFAGHGDLDRTYDDGWWIPSDATGGNPATYLSNVQVQMAMRSMKARHVLLISDSCYSGTLFGKSRALPPVIDDKYYLGLYNEKSRWGLTSGNKEPVSDAGSEGHSVFAYQLLKALKRNAKPFVSIQEIYTRIAPIISNNSEQTPLCRPIRNTGDQGGEFVFVAAFDTRMLAKKESTTAVTEPPAGSMDKEVVFWQSIQNSDDPDLFKAYLRQYPNGEFVPIAKRKLETLAPKKEAALISPKVIKPESAPEILKAKLFVATEPENARVRILNIKPKFQQGIELNPGNYHIEVTARGYEIKKQWIKLDRSEERSMSIALAKRPETGTIYISGFPSGAKVYVDGKYRGKMPVSIQGKETGNHELEVRADGYATGTRKIAFVSGEKKRLNIILDKLVITGNIHISGSPKKAKVYIDGDYIGRIPVVLKNVNQGRHRVKVEADGYVTKSEWLHLDPQESKRLVIHLKRIRKIVAQDGRHEKYVSGVVLDTKTGLEWYAGPDKGTDWNEAKRWAVNLSVEGGGWRMPTRNELKRLYQKGAGTRNMTPLLKGTGYIVWSEETNGLAYGWHFFFNSGGSIRYWNIRHGSNYGRGFAVRSRR